MSSLLKKIKCDSSDQALKKGFEWAYTQAMEYVHHGEDPVGLWYEAALPGRNAFCMRDVSHQSFGAAAMGLGEHTYNMLYRFAENISESKDYCSWWEITGDNKPCRDDYENDRDFWYNFPGSFEVIKVCYEQYLWTGKEDYINNPVFQNYYKQTCEEFVQRWDLDKDGILEHYRTYGRRGLASYNECDVAILTAGDMLASQYAAYGAYAKILACRKNTREAEFYLEKQRALKELYLTKWYDANKLQYYGAIKENGSFYSKYYKEGNFLPIFFGILDGEKTLKDALKQLVENGVENVEAMSYLPQIFYDKGDEKRGYETLLALCEENLVRREYPEISYSVIGTVVNQIAGVHVEEGEIIWTCSKLEKDVWIQVENISVLKGYIDVRHEGQNSTSFVNRTGKEVCWRAAFLGEHHQMLLEDKNVLCKKSVDAAGRMISYIDILIPEGGKRTVIAALF